jgi:putative intracellular protease/amidase
VADIVILPELWLGPDEDVRDRHPELLAWIRRRYDDGAWLYSACSGAVMLAATGLLDGCDATSHWGYADLFRTRYPKVRFRPNRRWRSPTRPAHRHRRRDELVARPGAAHHRAPRQPGRGAADRQGVPAEAPRRGAAAVPAAGARSCRTPTPRCAPRSSTCGTTSATTTRLASTVAHVGIAERTLKRRFKAATGTTLIEHVQHLRVEEAKRALEAASTPGRRGRPRGRVRGPVVLPPPVQAARGVDAERLPTDVPIRRGSFNGVRALIEAIDAFTSQWNAHVERLRRDVKTADEILAKAVRRSRPFRRATLGGASDGQRSM